MSATLRHEEPVRCSRPEPDVIPFRGQHRDLDLLTCGQFSNDSFAFAASDDKHGQSPFAESALM
jgi:hypothetical protein